MQDLVIVGILAIWTLLNSVLLFVLFRRMRHDETDYHHKLSDLSISSRITTAFSKHLDPHDITQLANDLFERIKHRFNLEAHSYSELITKLQQTESIEPKLKDDLVDFFQEMILISYKEESISDKEKDEIKTKLKMILRIFQ
ncbi:MAG: hypothetical protein ABIC95_03090 [archaeon]